MWGHRCERVEAWYAKRAPVRMPFDRYWDEHSRACRMTLVRDASGTRFVPGSMVPKPMPFVMGPVTPMPYPKFRSKILEVGYGYETKRR